MTRNQFFVSLIGMLSGFMWWKKAEQTRRLYYIQTKFEEGEWKASGTPSFGLLYSEGDWTQTSTRRPLIKLIIDRK